MEDIVGTTRKFLKFCDYLMIRMLKFGDYVTAIVLYIVFWKTKIIWMFPKPMEDLPKKRNDFIDYVKSKLVRF
jgi:hypothetical protein